jgi:hypothetical protein
MRHTMDSLATVAEGWLDATGWHAVYQGASKGLVVAGRGVGRAWRGLRSFVAAALHQAAETVDPSPRPVPVPQERVERFTASPGFEGVLFPDRLGGALAEESEPVRYITDEELDAELAPEPRTLGVPLTSLTVKELRSYCHDCGIKVTCRMRKAQLVAALVGRAA